MLRHWDAIGLLVPDHVDKLGGHRSCEPSQVDRLHPIVSLRQLGFSLEDIATILSDEVPVAELAGMLRLRRTGDEREHSLAEGTSERRSDHSGDKGRH